MATVESSTELLDLVQDISRIAASASGHFRRECTDLGRKIALLTPLCEEIRDSGEVAASADPSSSPSSSLSDFAVSFKACKRVLVAASKIDNDDPLDGAAKKISFQFQCVTWKLEKSLAKIPYDRFSISEEVREQVELVRAQLRRAKDRYAPLSSKTLSRALSLPPSNERQKQKLGDFLGEGCSSDLQRTSSDVPSIPDDFLCPISLELMRDPVIVSTGLTYERSYIQRWIDSGNITCPITREKLINLTLTTNYALKSLINQWCAENKVEQAARVSNGRMKKSDGTVRDVREDIAAIEALVRKLSSDSINECRDAVSEIRSLSKRSTDNRILIAEAGAIPALIKLVKSDDSGVQENAVTSILNLSIYEENREVIMLAGAVPSILQVLRVGSMEAKENAAATLFSLSITDENKIIIGASGAISALVELLESGSSRGQKDAATALFNLCLYQGNKVRAVRAGIIPALLKMMTDAPGTMVDEALTILSVLVGHCDARAAIGKASTIPALIDLLRTGQARTRENAVAILLALCKRDSENLACVSRLGAVVPLTELMKNGTERAKRKSSLLLHYIRKLKHFSP